MEIIKEHTHKWYTFGCKDATYLTIKGDYTPLSISERLQLNFHTAMCKYCKRFANQNKKINAFFKVSLEKSKIELSQNKKDALNQLIAENLKK